MIITYFRSSSYNNWDFCEMQYFLTYVCGYQFAAGKKADKGTITHKALEVIAGIARELQIDENATIYHDDAIGEVSFDKESVFEKSWFSTDEVDDILASRRNKQTYKSENTYMVKYGHTRMGVKLVEDIFERCYNYYVGNTAHKWYPADKRDCLNWVWMALDFNNGQFDPRNRTIHAPEQKFDIVIEEDWARYHYMVAGKEYVGHLAIKGTIDLITRIDEDTLEVCDWKTGQRIDWAHGGEKTYEKLCKDPQLMLYFYALRRLYPDVKNIIMTIFFIRDGGPFSICLSSADMIKVERMLEKRFNEIKASTKPELQDPRQKDFKCTKICPFYKNKFVENDPLNMCRRAEITIKEVGIEQATEEMMNPEHKIGTYHAPG